MRQDICSLIDKGVENTTAVKVLRPRGQVLAVGGGGGIVETGVSFERREFINDGVNCQKEREQKVEKFGHIKSDRS